MYYLTDSKPTVSAGLGTSVGVGIDAGVGAGVDICVGVEKVLESVIGQCFAGVKRYTRMTTIKF